MDLPHRALRRQQDRGPEHESSLGEARNGARLKVRRGRAASDRARPEAGRRVLAAGGRQRGRVRRFHPGQLRGRARGPRGVVSPDAGRSRVSRRAHDRDQPGLPNALGPRERADLPLRRGARRLRPGRSRHRRLLRQQARLHGAPELPAHDAGGEASPGRPLDAPPMGRGAPRRPLLEARSGGGQPRDRQSRRPDGPVHRRIQHLDAPPRRREGPAPLPAEDAAALALEPARRDQGRLRGRFHGPSQAADDPEGDGAHRHADDSAGRREQPGRGLEPLHQRREAGRRQGFRLGQAIARRSSARRAGG